MSDGLTHQDRSLHRETLRRLAAKGELERVARGVYLSPDAAQSADRDLLVVATRVPEGVVCLLSALAFHQLSDEMPHQVWMAIGSKARSPALHQPPLRIVRLSVVSLTAGVETHVLHDIPVRVFSEAKTIADCFKFRNKIGMDVALTALREGLRKRRFTMDELWSFARIDRVESVMRPYVEALAG